MLLVASWVATPLDDQVDHSLFCVSGAKIWGLAARHTTDRLTAATWTHAHPVGHVNHPTLFVRTAELPPFAARYTERRLLATRRMGTPLEVGDVQHSILGMPGAEFGISTAKFARFTIRCLFLAASVATLFAKKVCHPFLRMLRTELQFFCAGDAIGGVLGASWLDATLPVQVGHAIRGVSGAALGLFATRHTERRYRGAAWVSAFFAHFPVAGVLVFARPSYHRCIFILVKKNEIVGSFGMLPGSAQGFWNVR